MTKVAVEQGLEPFKEALEDAGFQVVDLKSPDEVGRIRPHAVVVSGVDSNFMGMDLSQKLTVVNASARSPEEVVGEVRRALGPAE